MYQKVKKMLAALCVFALVLTALPAVPAKAATAVPKFKKTYASVYENGVNKGKYTYTLTNLKKGQTVKWSVSGAGKSYVSVKIASSKATKSTMSNTLTVKTGGKTAAKNKKVALTAKVYSTAGKLQYTVKTSAKVKVKPTKVTLTAPKEAEDVLAVGKSYNFSYSLTPVNATSTNVWTVTGEDGANYASYMSSTGVFKPMKAGIYTIKLAAKIGTKTIKSASMTVEAADYMVSAKQTAADKVELAYSGDMQDSVAKDQISIKTAAGASMVIKDLVFSADGKTATVTTYSNFKDGVSYSVSDSVTVQSFQASVGTPVKLEILTQKATVGKDTVIEYALYDINGIDVTAAYPGNVEYTAEVTNGYINQDHKLYMTTVGKTATVTLKYTSMTGSPLELKDTDVITCVAAVASEKTNFTLTTASTEPNYTSGTYKDNHTVSIGTTYYAHFRALDTDNSELKYSSIKYESSDPDTLIISASGKVTPIRSGNVKIIVQAAYAGEDYTYSYDVTIAEAPYLKNLKLSTSSVSMSNVYSTEYQQYIDVSALNQYGESFSLVNETATITDNNNIKAQIATYDAASNRLVLNASYALAGTYHYTLTLDVAGDKASASFTVVVADVPVNGSTSYRIEIDKRTADLSLNADVNGSQYVTVRLAQYRGGVFTNYSTFTSATVAKGSEYYSDDLTVAGTTAKQQMGSSDRLLLKTMDITSGVCRKAQTGTYVISLQYYSTEAKGYQTVTTGLTLSDSQDEPEVRVERIKANKNCVSALELAQNCLIPANGSITECTVTGDTQPGSRIALKSGDQVNIKSVTVVSNYTISGGQTVAVTYTISVGKTLTNM